jgi:DNA polymerase I-like protein with 3'-5' exonuclease and polymerase domains
MILAQEHIYVPVDECRRIMEGYKELYSDVTALKYHIIKMCQTKNYIRNPFGRVRTFPSGEAPAAVDFWCQSTVADCLWCILKPVSEMAARYGGRLTTTVYDSILIQVPSANVEAAARELRTIMQREFNEVSPNFLIPVELEIGDPGASWGHLKKMKGR